MANSGQSSKEKEFGTFVSCVIAACIWWFIASEPSVVAWIIAGLLLAYLALGFCLLALYVPEPEPEPEPPPRAETLTTPPPPKQLIKDDKDIPALWEK